MTRGNSAAGGAVTYVGNVAGRASQVSPDWALGELPGDRAGSERRTVVVRLRVARVCWAERT